MKDQMECMCLQCGVSIYVDLNGISVEEAHDSRTKIVLNYFCPECGGTLIVIGRAGDEPHYRLE